MTDQGESQHVAVCNLYLVEVLLGEAAALTLSDGLYLIEPVCQLFVLLHELSEGHLAVDGEVIRLPRQVTLGRLKTEKIHI